MLPWLGSHAQSMYGDAVKADVKMKYVYSLDEALKKAKKEKKPIFCNCFEDWAMPCHGMNKKVFSNQEFADWMDKHFVNLFMDMSTDEGEEFASTYNVKFMAHYVILDPDGKLIHRIVALLKQCGIHLLQDAPVLLFLVTFNRKRDRLIIWINRHVLGPFKKQILVVFIL